MVINLARHLTITGREAAENLASIEAEVDLLRSRRAELQATQQQREKLYAEMYSTSQLLAALGTRLDHATPEAKREPVERLVAGIREDTVNMSGEALVVVTVTYKFSEQLGAEAKMTVYSQHESPTGVVNGH